MKGQAFVLPETVIDILQLIIFVAFFVGTFLMFSTYNMIIGGPIEERNAFDLVSNIIGNECLIYSDGNGNYYRGIFDREKLQNSDLCIDTERFAVEITDFQEEWKFGNSQYKKKFSLPVTIFDGENFNLGRMVIGY